MIAAGQRSGTPGGVLIIDDSLTVRAIIEEMLSGEPDLQVVGSASDVDTARALIRRHRPRVIILDLAMPGMDGMSFLDELATSPHAPVLVVSSHTRDGSDTAHEAVARGAAACFDKAHLVSHAKDFRRVLKKSARLKQGGQWQALPTDGAALRSQRSDPGAGSGSVTG